jgi:hypothetical protein
MGQRTVTYRERRRLRRYKKTLWGSALEAFGGKPAPPGMLRRTRTVCFFLKWAEHTGIYD